MTQGHHDAMPGLEGYKRFDLDRMAGDKLKPQFLNHRHQNQLHLHHRKVFADADSLTSAKWEIGA